MLKKRAAIYFVVMALPMGLGAGASNWLKLPKMNLPTLTATTTCETDSPCVTALPAELEAAPGQDIEIRIPDFGAIHPLVVGTFTLLLCSGILLAAEQPSGQLK